MDDMYEIRHQLETIVGTTIESAMQEYIDAQEKTLECFLQYPLINIELGLLDKPPEDMENGARRDRFSFLVSQTTSLRKRLKYSSNITKDGFETFVNTFYPLLGRIYNDYCTWLEIKDASSYAKSIVEKLADNRYQFKTSLVYDKYREETFYFYSFDNPEEAEQNRKYIRDNMVRIFKEYIIGAPKKIKRLPIDIDPDLLAYANAQVERDLSNLPNKIRSDIFATRSVLVSVIGFLYYLAISQKLYSMSVAPQKRIESCLIDVEKTWLINKISKVTTITTVQAEKIINYLVNDGQEHIFEFPLFEQEGHIITAPSLLVVNDWQFSIVNGHYYKNIQFQKRDKTISKSTQEKLKALLSSTENLVYREEAYYDFMDEGKKVNSDIDFAIFDRLHNVMLVIEAKWRDKHYYSTNQKRYKKIEDTLSKAFNEQISRHTKYLQQLDNPLRIFDEYAELPLEELPMPQIHCIAVDKRNQLHLNDRHMITEFMLLAFLREAEEDGNIDLKEVVQRISELKTTVEYKSVPPLKTISLDNGDTVCVDECEFQLEYT